MAESSQNPYIPPFHNLSPARSGGGANEVPDAIASFADSLRQFQLTRSINGATQELQTLKDQGTEETKVRQRQSELAEQLGQRALTLGFDPNSAIAAQNSFQPAPAAKPRFTNIAEIAAYGSPEERQNALDFFSKYKPAREPDALSTELKETRLANAKSDNELKIDKRFTSFSEALDESKARTGEFGRMKQFVNNADRVLVLKKQFPDGNIPPAQMAELATSSAALIGAGSHAAEATVGRFVPHTSGNVEADILQWLTNSPQGTQQQEFAKLMYDTADRERGLAQDKLKAVKYSRVAGFRDLEMRDKQRFTDVLESQGVDPEEYATFKKNGFKFPTTVTVISPDGKVGTIPESQLKEAMASGYRKQ